MQTVDRHTGPIISGVTWCCGRCTFVPCVEGSVKPVNRPCCTHSTSTALHCCGRTLSALLPLILMGLFVILPTTLRRKGEYSPKHTRAEQLAHPNIFCTTCPDTHLVIIGVSLFAQTSGESCLNYT